MVSRYETTEVRYNRQTLYDQVWSEPVYKVAKKYGISNVGLKKVCKKLNIPTPPVGYWQKKEFGKALRRTSLPPFKGPEDLVIQKWKKRDGPVDEKQCLEAEARITNEAIPENQIIVPSTLKEPHPLVARANTSLKNAKPNEKGLLEPRAKTCLDIFVGPENLPRALCVMDALLKGLETRGFKVSQDGHTTRVFLLGESLAFGIGENLDRKERELTPAQKKEKEKYSWKYPYPEYDYFPSGKLFLQIIESKVEGLQRNWSDTKKQQIENCLNKFIVGLINTAVAKRSEQLEKERWKRELEEERRRKEEERCRRQEEEERIDELEGVVARWIKSQNIRLFLDAYRADALRRYENIEPDSEMDRWLNWAHEYADKVDPLK